MAVHEECGVVGVYDYDKKDRTREVYYGLIALQHRGQESAGIAMTEDREVEVVKDMGLVSDIFDEKKLDSLHGHMGVGHVRYSTTGSSRKENAQPLVTRHNKGSITIAHNGNLRNSEALRKEFQLNGALFYSTVDSEVLAYLIAKERLACGKIEDAVKRAIVQVQGSFSLLVMSPEKLIAVRDPYGFRPLCMGKLDNCYVFASETCAIDAMGAEFIRDVKPGEMIAVTKDGIKSEMYAERRHGICIFEYIYFARSDSHIDGVSVCESRKRAGRLLAEQHPVDADLVIGVPESGIDAAMGYAEASGIPYGKGFVKNSYMGRTFIRPQQDERDIGVRLKLNVIKENVCGKRIVMIDDSIVRGTTCAKIVKLLKSAGATEVHMMVASPPFVYPCYYGTDIPSREKLAAVKYDIDGICKMIGADSLGYLDVQSLPELIGSDEICNGCFTGRYPDTDDADQISFF